MDKENNLLRIKDLLKERNITAKKLSEDIGISENSLSLAINGKTQPRFELLIQIAARLDVQVWQLFADSGNALNGFIEYQGTIHRIQTRKDLEEFLKKMD